MPNPAARLAEEYLGTHSNTMKLRSSEVLSRLKFGHQIKYRKIACCSLMTSRSWQTVFRHISCQHLAAKPDLARRAILPIWRVTGHQHLT
jgi:hypothetical protein